MAILLAVVLALLALGTTDANAAKSKLSGTVWTDADRDGVRDQGEGGAAGVRVELLLSPKRNAKPTIVRSTETDGAGTWRARNRASGFYRARVLLPGSVEGFAAPDVGGNDTVDSDVATSGPTLGMTPTVKLRRGKRSRTFDAGLLPIPANDPDPDAPTTEPDPPGQVASIGEFVWRDGNGDGIQDPGETGVGGVTVELWNADKTALLATTHTTSAGFWAFSVTVGTSFRVRVISPDLISPANQGGNDALDSDINATGADAGFTDVMTASESTATVDAGVYLAVGDLVWNDVNANGIREAGEPGLAGIGVQLWNAAITQLLGSATTDANGAYQIVVPAAGDYRMRVPSPGLTFSPKDVGDDTLDSDVNPSGPTAGFTDPFTITSGLTTTVDAGLY